MPSPSEPQQPAPRRRPPLAGRVLPLGRWLGVRVGVDSSWIIVVALVAGFVASELGLSRPGWGLAVGLVIGLLTSAAFLLSVLLHELGHALVANSVGVPVDSVTLYLFGGVAQHTAEPRRARDALVVAAAGPMVSAVLLLALTLFGVLLSGEGFVSEALAALVARVAGINLLILVLNALPGLPLDGGFVLRALVWAATGSEAAGTRVARAIGSLLGIGLLLLGVGLLLGAGAGGGLWLALLGWLVLRAGRNSATQLLVRGVLGEVLVRDALAPVERADRWSTLEDVAPTVERTRRPVLIEDGRELMGWVTPEAVRASSPRKRAFVPVTQVLVPPERMARIGADRTLLEALQAMNAHGTQQLAAVEGGRVVGVVTRDELFERVRARDPG